MSASEAVVRAVIEASARHLLALDGFGRNCGCGDDAGGFASWQAHRDAAIAAAAEVAALEAAADTWQRGAWGDTPRKADRVADRIAAAQFVGGWLRERAERIGGGS